MSLRYAALSITFNPFRTYHLYRVIRLYRPAPTVTGVRTEIDRLDPTPLPRQLAEILRGQIKSGEIGPREAIPSESQLGQRYEIGRGTVRSAIGILVEAGLVVSVQGRGVYVTPDAGH